MDFCRERPTVSLAAPGKTNTFIADVFKPRPAFNEIANFQSWGGEASEKMGAVMQRRNCAVNWVQFVVDQTGLVVIASFNHPVILATAKTATDAILKFLPCLLYTSPSPRD